MFDTQCEVHIPIFEELTEGKVVHASENGFPLFNIKELTSEEVVEELNNIQMKWLPFVSTFDILQTYFHGGSAWNPILKKSETIKEVCPKGLVSDDHWMVTLHSLESWASEYGVLPYSGGVLDQPNIIYEVFNTIMSSRSEYMSKKYDSVKKGDK